MIEASSWSGNPVVIRKDTIMTDAGELPIALIAAANVDTDAYILGGGVLRRYYCNVAVYKKSDGKLSNTDDLSELREELVTDLTSDTSLSGVDGFYDCYIDNGMQIDTSTIKMGYTSLKFTAVVSVSEDI